MYSVQDTLAGGFPHSEIHGSKFVRNSPWLIAAYDVLHRLSAPRHPPNALKTLDRSHYRCPSTRQQTESIEKTSFFEVMPDRRRLRLRIRSRHAAPIGRHSNKTFSSRCQTTRARPAEAETARILFSMRTAARHHGKQGGGARRDRTDDLLLAKQALSQLSYGPGSGHFTHQPI